MTFGLKGRRWGNSKIQEQVNSRSCIVYVQKYGMKIAKEGLVWERKMIIDHVEEQHARTQEWMQKKWRLRRRERLYMYPRDVANESELRMNTNKTRETHNEMNCSSKAWNKIDFQLVLLRKKVAGACLKKRNRWSAQTCSVKHDYLQEDRCKTRHIPVAVEFGEAQRRKIKE